ncbi:MAG: hypothetical protein ACE5G8_01020 [Anaerolineae bacterium]
MTRRTKIILAGLTTLFITCVCCGGFGLWSAWMMSRSFTSDTEAARALGAEIARYTLPPGYKEVAGIRLFGAEMVAISSDLTAGDGMLVMLMKVADGEVVDQAALEKQLELAVQQQFAFQRLELTLDRVEERTINGQPATLTFWKGENAAGVPYRQMSVLFSGSKGMAFLLAMGAEAKWDQQALDSLLDSIR